MTITDKDREAAKRFVYDYNVRDIFQSREGPVEDLADQFAQARAEGRAEERERIEKAFDAWLGLIPTAEARAHREAIGLAGYYERGGRPEDFKAAIRARGEKGKD